MPITQLTSCKVHGLLHRKLDTLHHFSGLARARALFFFWPRWIPLTTRPFFLNTLRTLPPVSFTISSLFFFSLSLFLFFSEAWMYARFILNAVKIKITARTIVIYRSNIFLCRSTSSIRIHYFTHCTNTEEFPCKIFTGARNVGKN